MSALPDRLEQRKKECLKKHPLSVLIKLSLKTGEVLCLEFQWLIQLEVICVLPTLTCSSAKGIAASDLLSSRIILSSLFPGDVGCTSPNPTTHYHLHRAGIDSFPSNPSLGIPYKWAQEIGGLDFMSSADVHVEAYQNNIERIIKAIRKRCHDRLSLAKELWNLEKGHWDYPPKMTTILGNFVTMTFDDFERQPSCRILKEENIVDNSYLFYKTIIHSNLAKVTAYIAVAPDYPKHAPIFVLEMVYKGSHNALNSEGIRDIEREVNVHLDCNMSRTTTSTGILTSQMTKLLLCLEVYIQTEYPKDFPVHSTFFRGVQGRNRSHPYRYITAAGGIYTHR